MNTANLRTTFLRFFESKNHQIVPSSSLVPPQDDKTLLFANAGMNQFKDVFLGFDKRSYSRATTAQKCVRAGGKHNDLENVGYTARHHTFFEMLGNFSFGDYFKREALQFAWEFLTGENHLNLPAEKLLATVYEEDDEAYDIWHNVIGLPADRIIRIGDKGSVRYQSDNFWQMGDVGPCGPCSEIFYDHGEHIWGGPPGSPEEDGDRFIEIWNCVFMQYNRDETGAMNPLPKPSVDTGMGLERIAAVLQNVHSNYEIDLFVHLLKAVARVTGSPFDPDESGLKVIADHIRSCAFLIADGVLPGNEGRGYVLRRIIRRAVRHGHKLGKKEPFFHLLVADLAAEMGDAYPELREKQALITDTLKQEELRFAQTLETGMALLDAVLKSGVDIIPGDVVFKLYDTYGFPYDLTADIAREYKIGIDEEGFEREMQQQRDRARAAQNFKSAGRLVYSGADTEFRGYGERRTDATVLALYRDGEAVDELSEGDTGAVVIDFTPFYAESGGQVGDVGYIYAGENRFEVRDTQKIKASVHAQSGVMLSGSLKTGDSVAAEVNNDIRDANMRNHSATHLMHRALRDVLGSHVEQKGSLVTAQRTRFDFAHPQPVSADELAEIENRVNLAVLANVPVAAEIKSFDDAVAGGAMALFGEKYGDTVRVLTMGGFSTELCGGTHVSRTGDIGLFKIISESGIAAGIRRIEAVTGMNALHYVQEQEILLKNAARELKAQTPADIATKIQTAAEHGRKLEKELTQARTELARHAGAALADSAQVVGGIRLVVHRADGTDGSTLKDTAVSLAEKGDDFVVLLAAVNDGKISLTAAVSKALTGKIKAGDLVRKAAEAVGGKGGGRPDVAQAGGTQPDALPKLLDDMPRLVADMLK